MGRFIATLWRLAAIVIAISWQLGAAHAAVTSLDLSGDWDYSLTSPICPSANPRGISTWTYNGSSWAWKNDGQTVDTSCNVQPYYCTDSGFVAPNPISPAQALPGMNTSCWAMPGGGSWTSMTFDSATQITVNGSYSGYPVTMIFVKRTSGPAPTTPFADDFSAGLGNWTSMPNGGTIEANSGAVIGSPSPSCTGNTCPGADLLLSDGHQMSGDMEASVTFSPVQDTKDPSVTANNEAVEKVSSCPHSAVNQMAWQGSNREISRSPAWRATK